MSPTPGGLFPEPGRKDIGQALSFLPGAGHTWSDGKDFFFEVFDTLGGLVEDQGNALEAVLEFDSRFRGGNGERADDRTETQDGSHWAGYELCYLAKLCPCGFGQAAHVLAGCFSAIDESLGQGLLNPAEGVTHLFLDIGKTGLDA